MHATACCSLERVLHCQGTELLESDTSLSEISDVDASSMLWLPDSSDDETVLSNVGRQDVLCRLARS